MFNIKQASISDCNEISELHQECFPDSFFTLVCRWGGVEKFYKMYIEDNPNLFLIAEEGDRIIGFCMGYLVGATNTRKRFIHKFAFRLLMNIIVLLLQGNKIAWSKVKQCIFSNDCVEYYNYDSVHAKQLNMRVARI